MTTSRVGNLGATPALTRQPGPLPAQNPACYGADPAQSWQHHPLAAVCLGLEQEPSPEQGAACSQVMGLAPMRCLSRQDCGQDTAGRATRHGGSLGSAESMHTWRAVGWGLRGATVSSKHQEDGFAQEAAVRGLGTRGIFLLKQMGGEGARERPLIP